MLLAPVAVAGAISITVGTRMPEKMAVHWNAAGQADGYACRTWGVFGLPLLGLLLALLFLVIPRIDPLRENIRLFAKQYYRLTTLLLAFLLAMHCYVLLWNAGARIPVSMVMIPCLAALLFYTGHVCERARPNWFVGVRTPWTLSDPSLWEKTNRMGGRMLKAAALCSLTGLLWPEIAVWLVLAPVLLTAVVAVVYSYVEYERTVRR